MTATAANHEIVSTRALRVGLAPVRVGRVGLPGRAAAPGRRGTRLLIAGGLVLVGLVGGGAWLLLAGPTTDALDGSRIGEWPATAEPRAPGGEVTATATEVRLAGGRTIRTGQ